MKTETAILAQLRKVKAAAQEVRALSSERKNRVLYQISQLLIENQNELLKANQADLKALSGRSKKSKATPAFLDRLTLNPARIEQMVESLRQVAALPDPVGEVVEQREIQGGLQGKLPGKLNVQRVRSPLGVIFMIFESRPNVAVEAFSLAFKSGNVIILRGGRESLKTTSAIYTILEKSLEREGVSKHALLGIQTADRSIPKFLLQQKKWIDVVVPRGGESLIEFVTQNSKIPIIKNDRGLCHVYVHEDADLKMASDIVINAKTQRPGVCNSMETLLVHEKVAEKFLPELHEQMLKYSLKWHVCPKTLKILKGFSGVRKATQKNWDQEYLDLEMNCRVVSSLDEALAHIEAHGSRHSESIVTRSVKTAKAFQGKVDAAAVYWNASTRFTDGFQLGLGGELGISTQKLHVRGPVGLRELTSTRWVIDGNGNIRE